MSCGWGAVQGVAYVDATADHTAGRCVAARMPWWDAHTLAARVPLRLDAERVGLLAASGRVLADPVHAAVPAPAFDAAAMDGYAVAGSGPWRVVGRVLAGGQGWPGRLPAGTAVEIGTGAVVPTDAAAVLPYEQSQCDGRV